MDIKKAIAQVVADIIGYISVAFTATTKVNFFEELTDGNITLQDMYVLLGLIWLFFRVINDGKKAFQNEKKEDSLKDNEESKEVKKG